MSYNNHEGTSLKVGRFRADKPKEHRMVVSVTGMDCASCAFGIEERIKKVKGVKEVKTAVILNKFFIYYDPQLVEPSAIKKIIDSTGYKNYITVEGNKDDEQEK